MRTKEELHPHTIRFPEDLYQWIGDEANQEWRTFNAQVIYLLELGREVVITSQKGKVETPPSNS